MATQLQQSKAQPWGLEIIFEPLEPIVDIVFVHGLTGTREETWTEKKSKIFWPRDLLPQDIPNARVFAFGYDADVVRVLDTASSNTVRDHGKSLAGSLAMRRVRTSSMNRPLIMVAHSLGGLVCEQALLIARGTVEPHVAALLDCTRGIIFMGTPHVGSDLAIWAKVLINISNLLKRTNKEIVRVLEPGSEMLANLQQEFHTMLQQRQQSRSPEIKLMCFYEEIAVVGVDLIVPKHFAILSGYPNQSIYANHMAMTKFPHSNDSGYEAVSGQLWLWINELSKIQASSSLTNEELHGKQRSSFENMDNPSGAGQRVIAYSATSNTGMGRFRCAFAMKCKCDSYI